MCSQTIYSEILVSHYKNPVRKGRLSEETLLETGYNPKCGDTIHLSIQLDDKGMIHNIMFDGKGCMLCLASASILTDQVRHASTRHALNLIRNVEQMFLNPPVMASDLHHEIKALGSVKRYPTRTQCVTLAWQTLGKALHRHRPA